jgi:hypothetical protein
VREAHPAKTFVSFVIFVVKNPFLLGALCVLCARKSEFRLRLRRPRFFAVNFSGSESLVSTLPRDALSG